MFAAARPAVKAVLKSMFTKPQNTGDWMNLAGRFVPEMIFPVINAASLPGEVSAAERGGAFGEALGVGLLGSLGGEFLGGLAGRRFAKSKKWDLDGDNAMQAVQTGLNVGGIGGGLVANFLPMAYTNSLYEREIRKQQEQQQAMQQLQGYDLGADLAGAGLLTAQPLFDPRLLG